MLEELLRPHVRAILGALLQGARSLSELTQTTGRSKPTVQRQLQPLVSYGIVQKSVETTKVGREAIYALRPYTLFLHIDPKKHGIIAFHSPDETELPYLLVGQIPQDEFREDVRTYVKRIAEVSPTWARPPTVIIFGSVAQGEATWKSDIDALILLPRADSSENSTAMEPSTVRDLLRGQIAEAASEAEHFMKPHFATVEEFVEGERGIIQEAKTRGVIVFGDLQGDWAIWQQMTMYQSITT